MRTLKNILRATALAPILLTLAHAGAHAQGEGATWRLQRGQDIASTGVRLPEMQIQGQSLSGSTGCKSFATTFSRRSDGRVDITRPSLARKACGRKQQSVENAFVLGLTRTQFIEEKGDQLAFLSIAREELLVWQRVQEPTTARATPRKTRARQGRRMHAEIRKSRGRVMHARSKHHHHRRHMWLDKGCFI